MVSFSKLNLGKYTPYPQSQYTLSNPFIQVFFMKNIRHSLFFGILLFLVSCQSDAPKSEISKTDQTKPTTFAHFYVRFLQSEKQVKATASFTQGMTKESSKPLKMENGVFFHNGNMNEKGIKNIGTRYSYDYEGVFSDKYIFRFKAPLKGKMNHEVKMNPITNYSFEGKISKSKGMKVTWEGSPLNENESLVFLINNHSFEIKGKTESNALLIPAKHLEKLKLGTAKIYLVRKQTQVTTIPNFTSTSEMEFYTHETTVTIAP